MDYSLAVPGSFRSSLFGEVLEDCSIGQGRPDGTLCSAEWGWLRVLRYFEHSSSSGPLGVKVKVKVKVKDSLDSVEWYSRRWDEGRPAKPANPRRAAKGLLSAGPVPDCFRKGVAATSIRLSCRLGFHYSPARLLE